MKRNILRTGIYLALSAFSLMSCTKGFGGLNTNEDAVQTVDVKTLITTMEMDAVIPCSDEGANEFQRACNLMGDAFAGYLSSTNAFNAGSYTCTYALNATDYNNYPFSVTFTKVMPAWLNIKYAHDNDLFDDGSFAIAEVIKVMAIQRVTDIYGPVPFTHFGEDVNPYDSQETVYRQLFDDLNAAILQLEEYAIASEGSTSLPPLASVDLLYQGDYKAWLKLANSQKLRMAIRVKNVMPEARTYAEEAVRSGVMEAVNDGAYLQSSATTQVYNPLEEVWNAYADTRMGATMDAYLNGYEDPRLPKYFSEAKIGGYHGIRSGIAVMTEDQYTPMSAPNVSKSTRVVWMPASEVAFLRAEGSLNGWNMGNTAEYWYKEGVRLSFSENGVSGADSYLMSDKTPKAFEDKVGGKYSAPAPSTITPRWNESDTVQKKLERIITQKWIAMYPNGQEAWSEFRRTGYPKVIPIVNNMSNGDVSTSDQIRRMTFPRSEYSNNLPGVQQAITLLGGGRDSGSQRLWWNGGN